MTSSTIRTCENRSPPKCVVVVDDDALFRDLMTLVLESELGVETVHVFASGDQFLASATLNPPPELIVLDFHMPGRNAAQTLAALREKGVRTPVVVMSMSADAVQQDQCLDAGASWVVAKPVKLHDLVHLTHRLLTSVRGRHP